MGFRRLVEKGGEDAEMIRFASITTGFRFSEIILLSKRKGRRVKTDRFFAAIPTLSRCIVLPPRFFLHDSSEKRGCSGTPKSLISSPCPELVPWSNVLETLRSVRSLGEIIAPRKEIVHGEFLEASVRGTSPHKFIDRSCKTPRRAAWTYVDTVSELFPRRKFSQGEWKAIYDYDYPRYAVAYRPFPDFVFEGQFSPFPSGGREGGRESSRLGIPAARTGPHKAPTR